MSDLVVLVVEDEAEVRSAVVRDLADLGAAIRVDEAESVDDAEAAIEELIAAGDHLGLVVADHRLPGRTGVDLLVELHADTRFPHLRKILLTGQAGHGDTIRAINRAALDHYLAKPWDPEELRTVVRERLTDHVVDAHLDPLPWLGDLDGPRLLEAWARRARPD
ncbi:MAG: response regulator [Actinomycetota bacterium]